MGTDRILDPLQFHDRAVVDRLRVRMDEIGFNEAGVLALVPAEFIGQPTTAATLPLLLRSIQPDSPLKVLTRILLMGVPTREDLARDAFGDTLTGALLAGGFLVSDEEGISSPFRVLPYADLFVIFDQATLKWKSVGRHAVMGVGTSSVGLANATPRRRVRRALDVGCGSGFQALQLASHCDEVVGIDINPRALALGRFGANLSNRSNITYRESDFFSAVAGETFDLIVSNPPFVISPESTLQYRDGGLGGDKVTETVLREAGKHLTEEGLSITVCEWAHYRGTDPVERVRSWVEANGCDVWISAGPPAGVGDYATNWLRAYSTAHPPDEFRRIFDQWMDYYALTGIEAVRMGLVVMRKREGKSWFHLEDAPNHIRGFWGDRLTRLLDTRQLLVECSRDDLLDMRFTLSPDACLRQELVRDGTRWAWREGLLMMDEPICHSGRVDQYIAGLCVRCNGETSLRELLGGVAAALGVEITEVIDKGFHLIEGLIGRGFLIPESQLSPQPATVQ